MSIYDNYDEIEEELIEGYELEIRKIIDDTVKCKIVSTVEELKSEKERNKKLLEIMCKQRLEIQVHDQAITQAILKTTKEVEKRLIGEFVPHDIIWYADSKTSHMKCIKCCGVGWINIEVLGKMAKANCPHCQNGNIYTSNYFPVKDIVSSIYFDFCRTDRCNKNSGVDLAVREIYLDKYDHSMKPESLFKSLEACKVECDALNLKEAEK